MRQNAVPRAAKITHANPRALRYSPYHMSKAEEALFGAMMAEDAAKRQQEKGEIGKKLQAQDEYEALNLYGKGD